MKRTTLILLTALMLAWAASPSIAASNPLEQQILKLQPRADRDGDGKLSKAEEAALHKMILKRYPRADADGDGVLSTKELQVVIRQATARAKRQGGRKSSTPVSSWTPEQLAAWLKRFPESDADGDGKLTREEAAAYRKAVQNSLGKVSGKKGTFVPNPGWKEARFPEHAVCYLTAEQMKEKCGGNFPDLPKSEDGVLRVVGTGHSFMAPGYRTLPLICEAAGFSQPLYTHIGGGMTGSARYKWEQENGIFDFDKKPKPKLLPAIANAGWDAMMWGPYSQDQPEYYACWMDFCLKYNPDMKFYLSDAWIRLWPFDGGTPPDDESGYTPNSSTNSKPRSTSCSRPSSRECGKSILTESTSFRHLWQSPRQPYSR